MTIYIIKTIAITITVILGSLGVLFDYKTNSKINKKGKVAIMLIIGSGLIGIVSQEVERRTDIKRLKKEQRAKFVADSIAGDQYEKSISSLLEIVSNLKSVSNEVEKQGIQNQKNFDNSLQRARSINNDLESLNDTISAQYVNSLNKQELNLRLLKESTDDLQTSLKISKIISNQVLKQNYPLDNPMYISIGLKYKLDDKIEKRFSKLKSDLKYANSLHYDSIDKVKRRWLQDDSSILDSMTISSLKKPTAKLVSPPWYLDNTEILNVLAKNSGNIVYGATINIEFHKNEIDYEVAANLDESDLSYFKRFINPQGGAWNLSLGDLSLTSGNRYGDILNNRFSGDFIQLSENGAISHIYDLENVWIRIIIRPHNLNIYGYEYQLFLKKAFENQLILFSDFIIEFGNGYSLNLNHSRFFPKPKIINKYLDQSIIYDIKIDANLFQTRVLKERTKIDLD